jgi:hypothetical protein
MRHHNRFGNCAVVAVGGNKLKERLCGLVAKWRKDADDCYQYAPAYEACADELEAALKAMKIYTLTRGEYCGITDEAYMFGAYSTKEKADAANPLEETSIQSKEWRDAHGIPERWEPKYEVREVEIDEVPAQEVRLV